MNPENKSRVNITTITVGHLETNCYLLHDSKGDAAIIDPGGSPERILMEIDKKICKPRCILITHGHSDHISGIEGVLKAWAVPVLMHRLEIGFLRLPGHRARRFHAEALDGTGFLSLEDGDTINISGIPLTALHTPGHTPGGVCYVMGDVAFTGDTLFCDGVGRTDFEGGNERQLLNSIKTKLLTLDDSTRIFPGHGPSSSIGREKQFF
ncbi:MAG: MBL fold metallo-hydrolase [bacterium]